VNSGQDVADARKNCIYGYSWFAGVKTAELIAKSGHCFVGPVKTNCGGYPKEEIKKQMKNWPAGESSDLRQMMKMETSSVLLL
jgi:hypothetical protein